jgi:hypothetical protein
MNDDGVCGSCLGLPIADLHAQAADFHAEGDNPILYFVSRGGVKVQRLGGRRFRLYWYVVVGRLPVEKVLKKRFE